MSSCPPVQHAVDQNTRIHCVRSRLRTEGVCSKWQLVQNGRQPPCDRPGDGNRPLLAAGLATDFTSAYFTSAEQPYQPTAASRWPPLHWAPPQRGQRRRQVERAATAVAQSFSQRFAAFTGRASEVRLRGSVWRVCLPRRAPWSSAPMLPRPSCAVPTRFSPLPQASRTDHLPPRLCRRCRRHEPHLPQWGLQSQPALRADHPVFCLPGRPQGIAAATTRRLCRAPAAAGAGATLPLPSIWPNRCLS